MLQSSCRGGVCLVRGGSPCGWAGFSLLGGVCLPGGSAWSGGLLPAKGGLPGPGGFSLLGGSAWSRGSACWGGLPARGMSACWGGLPARGMSACWGGSPCWGCLPGQGGSLEVPPVNRITDMCKNITLATTSLRPVMRVSSHYVVLINITNNKNAYQHCAILFINDINGISS